MTPALIILAVLAVLFVLGTALLNLADPHRRRPPSDSLTMPIPLAILVLVGLVVWVLFF